MSWLAPHRLWKSPEVFVEDEVDFDLLEQSTMEELREIDIRFGAQAHPDRYRCSWSHSILCISRTGSVIYGPITRLHRLT